MDLGARARGGGGEGKGGGIIVKAQLQELFQKYTKKNIKMGINSEKIMINAHKTDKNGQQG